MNNKTRRSSATVAEIVVVALILVAVNFLGYRFFHRIDVTENKQYTISPATKKILKGLDDPVTIEFYMSRDLPPQLLNIRDEARDKLQEFGVYSGGKFQVHTTSIGNDDTAAQEKAQTAGVPKFQLQVIKKEGLSVQDVFFGLVMNYRDKTETLPQILDPSTLEYELASRLKRLMTTEKPKIAFFAGPIALNQQQPPTFNHLHELLGGSQGFYEVVDVDASKDKRLPEGLTAVIIAGAFGMSDSLKYSIDQFLMNGGNVLLAIDPLMMTGQQDPTGGMGDAYPALPTMEDQIEKYGIKFNKKLVIDDQAAQVQMRMGFLPIVQPYPLYPEIGPKGINPEVGTLAGLEKIVMPWCCPLTDEARAGVKFTPLLYSSEKSYLMNSPFKLDPMQNWDFLRTTSEEKGPFKLAYLATGAIPSGFSAPPAGPEGGVSDFDASKHLAKADGKAKLLVFSNANFLADSQLQQFRDNATLVMNVGDMLALGEDIASIRSSPVTARPLKQLTGNQKIALRWVLVIAVPAAVILLGVVLWVAKGRRRHAIQRKYSRAG